MATLIHIIGKQGCGKSVMAEAIQRGMATAERPVFIIECDEALYVTNDEVRAKYGALDTVLILTDRDWPRHGDLQGQDRLIRISQGA